MAMARCCEGDYVVRDPICELNGLQAILDDRFFIPNEAATLTEAPRHSVAKREGIRGTG
jgi:hypothetical protein